MWPDVEGKTESFGEYLKREREFRHISLDELSKATKIRKYYLDAIERNEYKLLPGEAYLKGFVRAYAKHIGIDPDDAILRLESYLKEINKKRTPVPSTKPIVGSSRNSYLFAGLGIVLLVLVAVLILKAGRKEIKGTFPSPPAPVQKKTSEVVVKPTEIPVQEKQDKEQPAGPITLRIRAKEKTWIMVKKDDEKPIDVILWEGNVVTWEAKNRISLRIGNAQGVEITYNGIPLKNLGAKGEVVGLVLPDDLSKFQ